MKINRTFAQKCTSIALMALMAVLPIAMTGCGSATEVVQQAVNAFQAGKSLVATAQALVPELQTINPELAKEVSEYATFAGANLDSLITVGNAYLAAPSGDKYQNILNAADALTASVDSRVLAAAKITNPQSQARVLAVLTVASVSLHATLTILKASASKSQVKAMPAITARVDFQKEIVPLVDRAYAREQIAAHGYNADMVFLAAGM